MYVVVCEDLTLRQQAVQACHACVAARHIIGPTIESPYLVLLSVPGVDELVGLSRRLRDAGIQHRVFTEDDMGGRKTALATELVEGEARNLFKGMAVYRGRSSVARAPAC